METKNTLASIPASAFLVHLCPCLMPQDLLNLRLCSKQVFIILHEEEDSASLWHALLKRDFKVDASQATDWNIVLNVLKINGEDDTNETDPSQQEQQQQQQQEQLLPNTTHPPTTPLFGVDPASNNFFKVTHTPFETWKYWLKAINRLFSFSKSTQYNNDSNHHHHHNNNSTALWIGPYLLRAARFWRTIFQWCDQQAISGDVGPRIRSSLRPAAQDYPRLLQLLWTPQGYSSCPMAILSIYAFTSGQGNRFLHEELFVGLFGGYHAYGYYSCMSLCSVQFLYHPSSLQQHHLHPSLIIASDFLGKEQGLPKTIRVDTETGAVYLQTNSELGLQRAIRHHTNNNNNNNNNDTSPQPDDVLTWLEEFASRLQTGRFRAGIMGSLPMENTAILLFPQFPMGAEPIVTNGTVPAPVSRAVTKGIEVIASAVHVPQGQARFGFIYCIRIRLLTPGEIGYLSESERGFTSCQLYTRRWAIRDFVTGQTNEVHGQGVIGLYPILYEGGYAAGSGSTDIVQGTFQYQSCTGGMNSGSFGGTIRFIPGTIQTPTGAPFDVNVNPFELNMEPDILF